jgi:transposase
MTFPTHSLLRKAYRSDLSDAQWNRVRRLLPKPKARGRPRANEREVLNGILYVLSTGCRWEDLPHDVDASYQTGNRRLLDYQKRRIWQKILGELLKEADRKVDPAKLPGKERTEKRYCRQRWKVERSFAWINRFRRLERFFEVHQKSYRAFVRVFFIRH